MIQKLRKKFMNISPKNMDRFALISRVTIYTMYTPPVYRDFGWDLTIFLWFLILYLEILHMRISGQEKLIRSMMEVDMAHLAFISSSMEMMTKYVEEKEKGNDN